METKSKSRISAKVLVCIALILCLVSSLGASLVQTDGGKIRVENMELMSASGHKLSMIVCIPDTATAATPAPAIICSHGWYNNKQMQDLNYLEYARRGFVSISIDMYGHGSSDDLASGKWWDDENNANGMYDAVKYAATLPFVDASRIGVTGHSNGAQACREAVFQDNDADTQLIAAVLLVSNDPIYTKENTMQGGTGKRRIYDTRKDTYFNMFGSRDAGVVACQYDEFMHGAATDTGYSAPRDYINQLTAQSFLYFGTDPSGKELRQSYTLYKQEVDGKEAIRVVYNPNIIHPWAHFSKQVVASSVEFFDAALDAPTKLDNNNQIWQWKTFFNTIGIIGFFLFAVAFALAMTELKFFAALKAPEGVVAPLPAPAGKGKGWYWGGLIAGSLFGILTYPSIYRTCNTLRPAFFNQPATFYIATWTLLCGLFMLLFTVISYRVYNKKNGFDARARGVFLSGEKIWKTILLAVLTVIATYSLVFLSDYLFKTDFRCWIITLRAFEINKLSVILKFAPFYLVYYIMLSVSANSFNQVQLGKSKSNWLNLLVQCLAVAIGPILMVVIQYSYFHATGYLLTEAYNFGGPIIGIWLFPIIVYLPLAVVVSRAIYKRTNNPYLGGIIMGLLVTIASCTNTLTYLI